MTHRAAGAGNPLDQASSDHAGGERTEGLVGLEGQPREIVQGCVRILVQVAQCIPLHQRQAQWRQPGVGCAVMADLEPLDGEADVCDVVWHTTRLAENKLVYINMLI